jgi:hypothetical protein
MLIGTNTGESCLEKRAKEDLAGSETARRLPNRPLKNEAWSGNQQTKLTELLNKKLLSK